VSYFGRFPRQPTDLDRITLPEIMTGIEVQTRGAIRASHFRPPSAENAHCSFQGNFVRMTDGTLQPASGAGRTSCCPAPAPADVQGAGGASQPGSSCCRPRPAGEEARRARDTVARRWAFPEVGGARQAASAGTPRAIGTDSFDAFLEQAALRSFGISAMAFQDAWNIDLDRLRDCFLHVAGEDRIVPFCAYNVTDVLGDTLYR
jgi:hypothetical protein